LNAPLPQMPAWTPPPTPVEVQPINTAAELFAARTSTQGVEAALLRSRTGPTRGNTAAELTARTQSRQMLVTIVAPKAKAMPAPSAGL